MVIRWVFGRGPECSSLTLMRTAARWVMITRHDDAQLRVVALPDLVAAVLLQHERERELVAAGWHLIAVQRGGVARGAGAAVPATGHDRPRSSGHLQNQPGAGVVSTSVFEDVRPAPPDPLLQGRKSTRSRAGAALPGYLDHAGRY
jgi:hypothetical protein